MFNWVKTGRYWQNKQAKLMLIEWLLIIIAVTLFLVIIFLISSSQIVGMINLNNSELSQI
jgi:cell division protein FtsL